ncbi:MAG: response regulator [Campylobacterota bacterium]|nr:response regulator [Campylobacterota bacterium]
MDKDKKLSLLFIEDEKSLFTADTKTFDELFSRVDKVSENEKALKLLDENQYDIVLNDISLEAISGISFMQEMKKQRAEQEMVTLVSADDEDKIGDLLEAGIHAFVLTPEQFTQALEAIAQMEPQKSKK